MNAPGRYAASDNSFAKSTAVAATRGAVLIVIAVVVGVLLLWQGFDNNDRIVADDQDNTTTTLSSNSDTTTTTVAPNPSETPSDNITTTTTEAVSTPDPPNTVKVAVLNGRGERGLAGQRADVLKAQNYVTVAADADSFDKQDSVVYYTPGYEDEARQVAVALNGAPSVIEMAPANPVTLAKESHRTSIADYNIYVVLGADLVLG